MCVQLHKYPFILVLLSFSFLKCRSIKNMYKHLFLKNCFALLLSLTDECFDELLSGSCQLPELLHIALQKVTTILFFSKLVLYYLTSFFFKYSEIMCCYFVFINIPQSQFFAIWQISLYVRTLRASADRSESVILCSKKL